MISRAAAIEYLMTNIGWHDKDGYPVDDSDEKRAIITDLVNGIPAVDAVPVVRCENCRHRGSNAICVKLWVGTKDSFFCAFGERRDGK